MSSIDNNKRELDPSKLVKTNESSTGASSIWENLSKEGRQSFQAASHKRGLAPNYKSIATTTVKENQAKGEDVQLTSR